MVGGGTRILARVNIISLTVSVQIHMCTEHKKTDIEIYTTITKCNDQRLALT